MMPETQKDCVEPKGGRAASIEESLLVPLGEV